MAFLQALRRSIKGDKEKQHSISITPKAAVAIVPPKKVRCTSALRLQIPLCLLYLSRMIPAGCSGVCL